MLEPFSSTEASRTGSDDQHIDVAIIRISKYHQKSEEMYRMHTFRWKTWCSENME